MRYVVDTHALIWFFAGSRRLGAGADRALADPASQLVIPAIVLAEMCWVANHRSVGLTVADIMAAVDADLRFVVHPLDRAVVEKCNSLESISEMHDRQVAATALVISGHDDPVAVITRDENITKSGAVPVVW